MLRSMTSFLTARHCRNGRVAAAASLLQSCRPSHRQMTSRATAPPGPILTFLSPCSARSRSAVGFLQELFHLPRIEGSASIRRRDSLDELHFGASSSSSWDSVACACPKSGTILHFLSLSTDDSVGASKTSPQNDGQSMLHLMAVQRSHCAPPESEDQYRDALLGCRQRLADAIQRNQVFSHPGMAHAAEARLRGMILQFMRSVGRQPNPSWILEKIPSSSSAISPFLDLTTDFLGEKGALKEGASLIERNATSGQLRELALPFFPGSSSLQTDLSRSSLLRPLPGLYQVGPNGINDAAKRKTTDNPGLIFRPLPAAQEDLRLSPPSLVFQCKTLDEVQELVEGRLGGRTFKIGWRGHGQRGSLIVNHPALLGVDIRLCETAGEEWALSSSFDEAQDSLLAGSLAELQSTHVVSEGTSSGVNAVDPKTGNADCWIETRQTMKQPSGFLKQLGLLQKPPRNRVAKPPTLPYE